jgi:hypothetical protein
MNTGRRIQVGICRHHDDGHRAARRQAGNENLARVDMPGLDHFARDACDDRRLTLVALLVERLEPVPAFRTVGGFRLLRIHDQALPFLGNRIHARAGGEVIRALRTAMQHYQQRH